jgi:hypothetical protein
MGFREEETDDNVFQMSPEEQAMRDEEAAAIFADDGDENVSIPTPRRVRPPVQDEPVIPEGKADPTATTPTETDDPLAGMPEFIRDQLERIQNRLADLDVLHERLKQAESRIGGVTNTLRDLPKLHAVPSEDEILAALGDDEMMEDLVKEFPIHGAALKAREKRLIKALARPGAPAVDVDKLREELAVGFKAEMDATVHATGMSLLKTLYPDHAVTVKGDSFKAWFKEQPEERKGLYNQSPYDGIRLLRYYDDHVRALAAEPDIEAQRQERLESASHDVRPRSAAVRKKLESEMTQKELRDQIAREVWPEDEQ